RTCVMPSQPTRLPSSEKRHELPPCPPTCRRPEPSRCSAPGGNSSPSASSPGLAGGMGGSWVWGGPPGGPITKTGTMPDRRRGTAEARNMSGSPSMSRTLDVVNRKARDRERVASAISPLRRHGASILTANEIDSRLPAEKGAGRRDDSRKKGRDAEAIRGKMRLTAPLPAARRAARSLFPPWIMPMRLSRLAFPALVLLALGLTTLAVGQEKFPPPFNTQNPKDVPPTPLESLKMITAPEGFHVTLFA